MKALKILMILALMIMGLIHRRHSKPHHEAPARATAAQTAVNHEILQNAERLTETLRRCQQTARTNKQTK